MVSLFTKFVARTLEIPAVDPRLRKTPAHQPEREVVVEELIEGPAVSNNSEAESVTPTDQ